MLIRFQVVADNKVVFASEDYGEARSEARTAALVAQHPVADVFDTSLALGRVWETEAGHCYQSTPFGKVAEWERSGPRPLSLTEVRELSRDTGAAVDE